MTKPLTIKKFIDRFNRFAPEHWAVEGDPVGLHFGKRSQEIHKILVTLDVRPEVVEEAIKIGADFIVAHHPPIFRAPHRLTEDDPQNAMYANIIRHHIGVYAAHTNLDATFNGLNDWLSEAYGLHNVEILSPHMQMNYYRITTYVPQHETVTFREALKQYNYGKIGDYDNCQFQYQGIGRFTPTDQAHPTIGEINKEEKVYENAVSFICTQDEMNEALATIRKHHPYEEPAIDCIKLENLSKLIGLGRIGDLEQPVPLNDFITMVKQAHHIDNVRIVTNDENQYIQRIAVLGGAGASYYRDALKKGAEVFVTADVSYHTAHDMLAENLTVIDPGHHMESICKTHLMNALIKWQVEEDWPITITMSQCHTDPFLFR